MKRFWTLMIVGMVGVAGVWYGYDYGRRAAFEDTVGLDMDGAALTWEVIQRDYLRANEFDRKEIGYGLIRGLVGALGDEHSSFFDPEEADQFEMSLSGELKGIGAELKKVDGLVKVVAPLPNTPAERAGILAGDIILEVDGVGIQETDTLFRVVSKIRGKEGTTVVLTVLHEEGLRPEEISIVRASIHIDTVRYEEKDTEKGKYSLISVGQFSEQVGAEFEEALKKAVEGGTGRLVLDLRFNGGGFLDGAVDLLSYFVQVGKPVVTTRDSTGSTDRKSVKKALRWEGKVVVLANGLSASASEIVVGALQDYEIAKFVGEKTFGKGSVQEVVPVGGYGLLRLTIAEWLTPKGRLIDGVGLEPDIVAEDKREKGDDRDEQLEKAVEMVMGE